MENNDSPNNAEKKDVQPPSTGTTVVPTKEQRKVNELIDFQLNNIKIETPGAFVVKMLKQPDHPQAFNRLAANVRAALDARGFQDTMVLVLVGDQVVLESVDENAMFRAGWLHKSKVVKLLDQYGTPESTANIKNVLFAETDVKQGIVDPNVSETKTDEKKAAEDTGDGYGM